MLKLPLSSYVFWLRQGQPVSVQGSPTDRQDPENDFRNVLAKGTPQFGRYQFEDTATKSVETLTISFSDVVAVVRAEREK
jgi:hypothetical protein